MIGGELELAGGGGEGVQVSEEGYFYFIAGGGGGVGWCYSCHCLHPSHIGTTMR